MIVVLVVIIILYLSKQNRNNLEGKMKNQSYLIRYFRKFLVTFFSTVFIFLASFSCSSSNQELRVSGFRFTFEGNDYYIRSIYCPNNPQSCNHLIGKDFEAVDMNQDRVIDKIVKGDVTIHETQEIYSYSLDLLEKENKLSVINKDTKEFQYTVNKSYLIFEIISFQPELGDPFNQFKVVQKQGMSNNVSLFNDMKADGSLDEKLKGSFSIIEAQKRYQETIEEGVRDNRISRVDDLIRVN